MRNFSARETVWLQELDGIELASFQRRALAFVIDWVLVGSLTLLLGLGVVFGYLKVRELNGHPMPADLHVAFTPGHVLITSDQKQFAHEGDHEWLNILQRIAVPVLYFGLLTWSGGGRTPGKRAMRIRVVSIAHRHLTLWHSIERALGYGAAALELGFGFVQFFIHPYRRCAQDRLAETIVVTERAYQTMLSKP